MGGESGEKIRAGPNWLDGSMFSHFRVVKRRPDCPSDDLVVRLKRVCPEPARTPRTKVRCVCGAKTDDRTYFGLWVACDGCGLWNHATCLNFRTKQEAASEYLCAPCRVRIRRGGLGPNLQDLCLLRLAGLTNTDLGVQLSYAPLEIRFALFRFLLDHYQPHTEAFLLPKMHLFFDETVDEINVGVLGGRAVFTNSMLESALSLCGPALIRLDLSNCKRLTAGRILGSALAKCTSLQSISLGRFQDDVAAIFFAAPQVIPSLVELDLRDCKKTALALRQIAPRCPALHRLNLSNWSEGGASPDALRFLVDNCPALTCLDLTGVKLSEATRDYVLRRVHSVSL